MRILGVFYLEYTAESDGVMVAEEELITDEHVEPFLLYAEEVAPDRDNLQVDIPAKNV